MACSSFFMMYIYAYVAHSKWHKVWKNEDLCKECMHAGTESDRENHNHLFPCTLHTLPINCLIEERTMFDENESQRKCCTVTRWKLKQIELISAWLFVWHTYTQSILCYSFLLPFSLQFNSTHHTNNVHVLWTSQSLKPEIKTQQPRTKPREQINWMNELSTIKSSKVFWKNWKWPPSQQNWKELKKCTLFLFLLLHVHFHICEKNQWKNQLEIKCLNNKWVITFSRFRNFFCSAFLSC